MADSEDEKENLRRESNYVTSSEKSQKYIVNNMEYLAKDEQRESHLLKTDETKPVVSENNFAAEKSVVNVVDNDIIIAWTFIQKLKTGDICCFFCLVCKANLKSLSSALVHLQQHNITNPYNCIWCQETSQTESEAKIHYRSHGDVKKYAADRQFAKEKISGKHYSSSAFSLQFGKKSSLNKCFTIQDSEGKRAKRNKTEKNNEGLNFCEINGEAELTKTYRCDGCSALFLDLDELTKHKATEHDAQLQLDCKEKVINFPNSFNAFDKIPAENDVPSVSFDEFSKKVACTQSETKKTKNKLKRNFTCLTCGKVFKGSKPLRDHEVVHTGAREFPCEICGKAFGTRANMKIHLTTHSDKKPFICDICNAAFRQKDSLKVHLRKHNGERPFLCHVCNMTFDRNFTLKNHVLTHSEAKSFVCVVCGKAFTTRGGLNNHERLHMKDPNQKKPRKPPSKPGTGDWVCDECGNRYSTRSNLKMHQRSHGSTRVTHTCNVCGRLYKHKDSLEVHMRRHRDIRPYTCLTCGRNFFRNTTLKLHLLTHTGEKPHKCSIGGCEKAFTQASSLQSHLQNHKKQLISKQSVQDSLCNNIGSMSNRNISPNAENTQKSKSVLANPPKNCDSLPDRQVPSTYIVDVPLSNTTVSNPTAFSGRSATIDPNSVRNSMTFQNATMNTSSLINNFSVTNSITIPAPIRVENLTLNNTCSNYNYQSVSNTNIQVPLRENSMLSPYAYSAISNPTDTFVVSNPVIVRSSFSTFSGINACNIPTDFTSSVNLTNSSIRQSLTSADNSIPTLNNTHKNIDEIQSTILNGVALNVHETLDSPDSLSLTHTEPHIIQSTPHLNQLDQINSPAGSLTNVTSNLVWDNTVLSVDSNICGQTSAISHAQQPGMQQISQVIDQPLYVLSSDVDSVPLLVSIDGQFYQPDALKTSEIQNNFVPQLN